MMKRWQNSLLIGIPFVGSIYAVVYAATNQVSRFAVFQMAFWYLITGVGIGVGFHRHFTHQSFKTYPLVRLLLGIAGSFAFQGTVIRWIADHRRHHKFSDREYDTHSPHTEATGKSWATLCRNLWHAHVGWMFDETTTDAMVYAPDLLRDPISRWLTRWYPGLTLLSLALPYAIGHFVGGGEVAFQSLLLAGFLRTTLLHNVIWAVNSIGHQWGNQSGGNRDQSRNNWILAVLTFGEGWHNNHHQYPRCAYNNWSGYQFDINGFIIRVFAQIGVAWDICDKRTTHVKHEV